MLSTTSRRTVTAITLIAWLSVLSTGCDGQLASSAGDDSSSNLQTAQLALGPDYEEDSDTPDGDQGGDGIEGDDPLGTLQQCVDGSDTSGQCMMCCIVAFNDDPELMDLCIAQCDDQCGDDTCDDDSADPPAPTPLKVSPRRISPTETGGSGVWDEKPFGYDAPSLDDDKDAEAEDDAQVDKA